MNKKFILTSILALTFALPAMAEITSGATCDTTNLGQSENNSTANVEATWTANRYQIKYKCESTGLNISTKTLCQRLGFVRDCDAPYAYYDQSYTFVTGETLCQKEGYTFANWSCTDSSNNTTTYNASQQITWNIDSDLNCTATWTANTINIDWYSDGSRVAQNSCTYGSTITLPTEPTKTGYTFNGWLLHDDCPELSTAETCNANSACLWNGIDNQCMNFATCHDLSEAECTANNYCKAMYQSILTEDGGATQTFIACDIKKEIICSSYTDSELCSEFMMCSWNTNTNKCEYSGNILD